MINLVISTEDKVVVVVKDYINIYLKIKVKNT